jgi:serine/threonine protein kinase
VDGTSRAVQLESVAVAQEGTSGSPESAATRVSDDAYLRAIEGASEQIPPSPQIRGVPETSVPTPGQMLAGKYRVERVLGAGGMGVVVAARHVHLDAPVALKLMTEETLADHALVSRFLREARATARLRGEHVVRVSDVGELDSGAPYMVMEYLQGQDLAALLSSLGPPPVCSAVEYAIQTCEALQEAHDAGIVHRDIKPSNLFLTRRPNGTPCIKVLDFGIAKAITMVRPSELLHSTSTRAVFGTPFYMAPEQMRSARDVDGRADLWSLGASLYELISGTPPFPAESLVDLAYRIANERPPSLRARWPEVPYGLEQIVFRCLERDPALRFPDARSLALALAEHRTQAVWDAPKEPEYPYPNDYEEMSELTRIDPIPMIAIGQATIESADEPLAPVGPRTPTSMEPTVVTESLATSNVGWGRSQRFVEFALAEFAKRRQKAVVYVSAASFGIVICLAVALTRSGRPASVEAATAASALDAIVVVAATAAAPVPVTLAPQSTVDISPPSEPRLIPKIAPAAPAVAPTARAASTARPGATGCALPYYFDELGRKIFKPECVN